MSQEKRVDSGHAIEKKGGKETEKGDNVGCLPGERNRSQAIWIQYRKRVGEWLSRYRLELD